MSPKSLERVDPEIRGPLQAFIDTIGDLEAVVRPETLDAFRAGGLGTAKPFMASPRAVKRSIPGRDGAPEVELYVINSDPQVVRPAILHIHGGGYVFGSALASVAEQQVFAKALDCVVVTVEYRLAPETAHPGSLEDNYAALLWMHRNARELGIDPARIAIAGESAGGGHAAALALAARDRGEVKVCFQALTYPMLDDRTASTRQVPEHIGQLIWTRNLNILGWRALLGRDPGGADTPATAAPARATDLSGLPPTFISVGDIDLFVQEDLEYAARLVAAGVPTEVQVLPGAPHGFYVMAPTASVSKRYTLALTNALARAFGRPELTEAPEPAPAAAPAAPVTA